MKYKTNVKVVSSCGLSRIASPSELGHGDLNNEISHLRSNFTSTEIIQNCHSGRNCDVAALPR